MATTTVGMGFGSRCPVCLGGMSHGQAIFTAECSHTFHLRCAPWSALCPVCGVQWRDTPAAAAAAAAYDDDDPVEPPPPPHAPLSHAGARSLLVLKTHCEYPALPKAAARDAFAVLVHAKAPSSSSSAAERAPVDLVTVLDVSKSMAGEKLSLVKRAMGFVIDNLGAGDRLSIVAFDTGARRVLRLVRMTDDVKAAAKRAVESLVASGCTNIRGGLDEAAKVLHGRRHRNAVASVILLTDGQDNQSKGFSFSYRRVFFPGNRTFHTPDYGDLVPLSFTLGSAGHRCPPVHAFGFGTDHDAAALHGISEVTGGTFSFVEDYAAIQDAFARCVGGLLSVAAQEACVAVECLHPGVSIRAIKSGRYAKKFRFDADGGAATVDVGELYADEERRFLLLLDVPSAATGDAKTPLVSVRCTYRDTATGQAVEVAGGDAVVERPVVAAAADVAPSMEVERERVRVEAAEDIAQARDAAELGDYGEAAQILDARREVLGRSAPVLAGDAMCKALVAELHELSMRVADEREYEESGRACFLAGMSSHAQQRGSSSVRLSRSMTGAGFGFRGCPSSSAVFATPAMRKMEELSAEKTREQQDQPPPENGSTAVPRPRLEERLAAAAPRLSMVRRYRRLLPPLRR